MTVASSSSPHFRRVFQHLEGKYIDHVVGDLKSRHVAAVRGIEGEKVEGAFAQALSEMKKRDEITDLEIYSVAKNAEIPPCTHLLKQKVYINIIYERDPKPAKSLRNTLQDEVYIRDFPLRNSIDISGRVYVWNCNGERFHLVIQKVDTVTKFFFDQEGYHGEGQLFFTEIRKLLV